VTLVLYDFGTGYSSLSYLQRFPIDVLKIDRSFIAALGDQGDSQPIIAAIINMARALKIDVIAEGIETPTQADRLQGLGCQRAQGYLYARPLPAEAISALLDSTLPVAAPANSPLKPSPGQSLRTRHPLPSRNHRPSSAQDPPDKAAAKGL